MGLSEYKSIKTAINQGFFKDFRLIQSKTQEKSRF